MNRYYDHAADKAFPSNVAHIRRLQLDKKYEHCCGNQSLRTEDRERQISTPTANYDNTREASHRR